MSKAIREFVINELSSAVDPTDIADQSDLLELGLDSMMVMRLINFLEDTFSIMLPDNEIVPDNLKTLSAINAWVQRHQMT